MTIIENKSVSYNYFRDYRTTIIVSFKGIEIPKIYIICNESYNQTSIWVSIYKLKIYRNFMEFYGIPKIYDIL